MTLPTTRRALIGAAIAAGALGPAAPIGAQDGTSPMNALRNIRSIDYTIIFARNMPAMRRFYEQIMGFSLRKELGPQWIEYAVGSQVLALTERGMMWHDRPTPSGQLSLQLAFRVAPSQVQDCANELRKKGIEIVADVTDQSWGHRTMFFRDPDGNLLEIFADI